VVPSDLATALGAFLSHSGKTSPIVVFGTVTVANVASSMLVYALSRHAGRRFFATPTGRRLLSPEAIAVIERDYLRLGMVGLFIARFIPGVRAVVPACAGVFDIPWGRTLLVIVSAAVAWYGTIVGGATLLGAEWPRVRDFITSLGQVTGLAAGVLAVLVGALVWFRRRRKARAEPVLAAVEAALGPAHDADEAIDPEHAARLIIELAYADEALDEAQRAQVESDLRARWGLAPMVPQGTPEPGRLGRLATRLTGRFSTGRRVQLVERMWQAAFAEGTLAPEQEDWLLRRAGELLGLAPDEVATVRRRSAPAD
jgi:membrane protein DedA with SNARE-associated domain